MPLRNALVLLLTLAVAQPASALLDAESVRAAAEYSAKQRGTALLVIEAGKTLREEYPGGGGRNTARKIYSGTKAFWSLAALAAVQDGLLTLDERVAETIPAWHADRRKARVTIRQLLDFSSGLEPGFRLHNDDPGDRDAIALRLPLVADPGTAFIYGPSGLQVFHAVLKAKLPNQAPREYLERRVLRPLGLGRQRYLQDRAGNPLLATGWVLSARQWAKIGELVLNGGAPVVEAGSLAQSWRGSSANRAYSLGWWNNRAAASGREVDIEEMLELRWSAQTWRGARISRAAPSDLVAGIGSRGQRLYVIPSLRLVVVRQGDGGSFSDGRFLRLLLGKDR